MSLNKVEVLFESSFLKRNGLLLLQLDKAIEFINECEKQGVVVLGFDAFLLSPNGIQPIMEMGMDFTLLGHSYPNNIRYSIAREKIGSTENLYYEIVIEV